MTDHKYEVALSDGMNRALLSLAARRGIEPDQAVRFAVYKLCQVEQVRLALQPPEGVHTLDGETADQIGAESMQAAADQLGVQFVIAGASDHHTGKVFKPSKGKSE